jgi:DNA-binding MarR family transcriptional regulator
VSVAARPAVGRALPVSLTDAGRSLLDRADAMVLAVEERMLSGLPPDEVQQLSTLLGACARNLARAQSH